MNLPEDCMYYVVAEYLVGLHGNYINLSKLHVNIILLSRILFSTVLDIFLLIKFNFINLTFIGMPKSYYIFD